MGNRWLSDVDTNASFKIEAAKEAWERHTFICNDLMMSYKHSLTRYSLLLYWLSWWKRDGDGDGDGRTAADKDMH